MELNGTGNVGGLWLRYWVELLAIIFVGIYPAGENDKSQAGFAVRWQGVLV